MCKIINLFGAPGSGKSTLSFAITADLKRRGKRVEHAREGVKEEYAKFGQTVFADQLKILSEQYSIQASFADNCDYVVTDGPILHSYIYAALIKTPRLKECKAEIQNLSLRLHRLFDNFDILVKLPTSAEMHVNHLRIHDYDQSLEIEEKVSKLVSDRHLTINNFFGRDLWETAEWVVDEMLENPDRPEVHFF